MNMGSTYEAIADAIRNQKQVHATYKGHAREMCPHTLGTKNGRMQALFYQFGGTSSSGLQSDPATRWRCIPIDDLEDLQIVEGEWHTASNHSQPQTCIDDVHVEVIH